MIRTYLKIAIRNLQRYKGHAIINISGLAVGITCCILIMLFVRNEFEYDTFHSKKDRLYRVWQHEKYEGQDFINVVTPIPMANALAQTFGEVEATCRIYSFNPLVQVNGQSSFTGDVRMVDSTFFQLFDFFSAMCVMCDVMNVCVYLCDLCVFVFLLCMCVYECVNIYI